METKINELTSKIRDLTNNNYKLIDEHNNHINTLNDKYKQLELV